ncbi:hypothetical protein CQ018_05695 [Arthrobacter sp. MYb227]|nr:hypothetical protein CQ018_05695 [Arthrobacter sp. MYb227]
MNLHTATKPGDTLSSKIQRSDFTSESAVYGLVVVSALLIISDRYDVTSLQVFFKVLGAVLVFWLAHVFAAAVAHLNAVADKDRKAPLKAALRHGISHSSGMLIASVIPLLIVLLGVTNLVRDDVALWTALWVDVLFLGLLGYFSAVRWTRQQSMRIGVGLSTALLGVVVVILKALVH